MMNKIIYTVIIALCVYLVGCGGTKPSLSSDDPDLRREAMRRIAASSEIGKYLPFFAGLLENDGDPMVRALAARYIGRFKYQPAAPALIKALGDQSPVVRQDAAIALGIIGDKTALPALIKLLDNETEINADIRRSVAQALRPPYIAEPEPAVIVALIERLNDKDNGVALAAWQSLKLITKQDISNDSKEWEKWWGANKKP